MKKQTAQRVIDADRGVANGGQVYASVAALGPAVAISPAPTGLAVTSNTIQLSAQTPMALISLLWYPPQAQTVRGYQLQVATDSGFTTNVEYFSTGSDTTTSLELITSATGITYYIRVRVFAGNLISEWSSSISVLAAADTTPAGTPTGLAYTWDGGDLLLTWTNPSSTNLRDVEIRIWNSSGKTVLYHTGFSAIQRYTWTLPQQRIDTSGSLDAAVYVELRSRTWSQVLGTSTAGISPANSAPSAPSSVALISSIGTLTISVTATPPTDFAAYRYRIIQTSPSASDVVFDSPSPLENYSLYAQATYQVGVKVLDVYGQLSSETLSSSSVIDTLTISSLRADIIYSDSDGNSDATLHVPLSNAVLASGGITYATTSTWNKFVRGERPMLDRYRIVTLSMAPASGTSTWYLRVSSDATNWTYYAGPVTSSRILTAVANAAAAQAAAVSAATLGGTATSKVELPATIEARYIEVWVRNAGSANTTIYEFYPRRLIEADDIYVQNLAAIVADLGTINAGTLNAVTINSSTVNSSTINGTTINTSTLNAAGGSIVLNASGMSVTRDTSSTAGARPNLPGYVPGATHSIRYVNGATVHGYIGQTSDTYTSPATVVNEMLLAVPGVSGQQSNITLFADHTSQGSEVRFIAQSNAELAYLEVMANTGAGISYIRGVAESFYLEGGVNIGAASGAGVGELRSLRNDGLYQHKLERTSATARAYGWAVTAAGDLVLDDITAATRRLTLLSGGDMGIGTASAAGVKLLVQGVNATAGTYTFNAKNSTGANLLYLENNGTAWVNVAWTISDSREKDEIADLDIQEIDQLDSLRIRKYKRLISGEYELGFIAQEVQAVRPEMVREGMNGVLGIRSGDILALLAAAYKREKVIVRNLRQRIIALEAKLA